MAVPTGDRVTAAAPPPEAADLLAACPEVVVATDPAGRIGYVSASVTGLLDRTPEELLGTWACELLAPEEVPWLVRLLARAQVSGEPLRVTHRLRRRDGGHLWGETVMRAVAPGPGRPAYVVAVVRDVTERLAVDQVVAQMRDAWTSVFDHLREGIVVVDEHSVILAANQPAERFLLVAGADLVGRRWPPAPVTVIDENGHPMPGDRLPATKALRTGVVHQEALAYRRGDGSVVWLSARAVPLQRPGEVAPSRVVVLLEDAVGPGLDGAPLPRHAPATEAARALLTPREQEVLRLLGEGLDVRAVADRLDISLHTARGHVKAVMRKLDARTQLQAVVLALRAGLLEPR